MIELLNEDELGAPTQDLCRRHGNIGGTYYRWKAELDGMDVPVAAR